jgi:CheY-like chemotaxis protein
MGASVLIIDADEAFAHEVAEALRAQGVDASTTGDGKLGLDLARINLPSAIVLCVELPRMSGYSVCAKLKKDEALRSVPVLITSAEATKETFQKHRQLKDRAEEYVRKPVRPEVVVSTLAPYLDLVVEGGALDISDDVLGDAEAFSANEMEALSEEDGDSTSVLEAPELVDPDAASIDDVLRALGGTAGSREAGADDPEAMTTVAPLVGVGDEPTTDASRRSADRVAARSPLPSRRAPSGATAAVSDELRQLRRELEAARSAQAAAERERDRAVAAEQAAASTPSGRPSAGSHLSARDALQIKKERNALEREVLDLKDRLNEKEREALAFHEREEELELRLVELDEELAEERDARASAEADVEALRATQTSLESRADAAASRAEEAEARVAELDASVAALSEELDQTRASVRMAEGAMAKLEASVERLTTDRDEARRRGAELESTLLEREAELEAASGAHEAASSSLTETTAALGEARTALELRDGELGRLENELEATHAEATNLRQQVKARAEEIDELKAELEARAHKIEAAQESAERLRERISALEAAQAATEDDLARAYERIEGEDHRRGKALQALEIAIALLDSSDAEPVRGATIPVDDLPGERRGGSLS